MEMSLFEVAGKIYTRYKITKKDWKQKWIKSMFNGQQPSKENDKYIYFEVDGDKINNR